MGFLTGNNTIKDKLDAFQAEGPYNEQVSSPEIYNLRNQLDSLPFSPLSQEANFKDTSPTYQAKDFSGALPEYDYLRNKTSQQFETQGSQNDDAIARRFASMGMLNSGSAIKQQELSQTQNDQQRSDALQGIGFQEAQTRRSLQQQEAQREFQSQEAGNQRQFAGQQAVSGRNFQRDQYNAALPMQKFEASSKLAMLDAQAREASHQTYNDRYNQLLSSLQAGDKHGLVGSLFNGGVPGLENIPLVGGLFS